MLHFLADENFNNHIVTGLLRRIPDIDIVRAQNIGLSGAADPVVLAWAAEAKRIILTHDAATIAATTKSGKTASSFFLCADRCRSL
jgi:predicted nuclease of predicted toxin-antitoxin system